MKIFLFYSLKTLKIFIYFKYEAFSSNTHIRKNSNNKQYIKFEFFNQH